MWAIARSTQRGIHSRQPLPVVLLGQELRLEPAHLTGAGGVAVWALPSHDYSHGWVLGQADFGVELEPERGIFAVTHRVPS